MTVLPTATRGAEIDRLLERLETSAPVSPASGRLIFALDATASREPTWDRACRIQGEMFEATAGLGALSIQLCFYRGYAECKNSRWVSSASDLHQLMRSVSCIGGHTQIERILGHTITETQRQKVAALVFVGDAMEEQADRLCHLAGELGALGTPIFVFQEGELSDATATFRQMARLSHGAHLTFDLASITRLKELLAAVAVYATGGLTALEDYGRKHSGAVPQLAHQLTQRRTP
jgi:hypothetical protein